MVNLAIYEMVLHPNTDFILIWSGYLCVEEGFTCIFSAQSTSLSVVLFVNNTSDGVIVRLIYCEINSD